MSWYCLGIEKQDMINISQNIYFQFTFKKIFKQSELQICSKHRKRTDYDQQFQQIYNQFTVLLTLVILKAFQYFSFIYIIKMSGPLGLNYVEVHYLPLAVAWLGFAQVGLWSLAFKHYTWAVHLHMYCMLAVTIITLMSCFFAVIQFGIFVSSLHAGLGITIMLVITIETVLGIVSWALQKSAKVGPKVVVVFNYIHRILGWCLIIMVMVQSLHRSGKTQRKFFISFLSITLVSQVFYLVYKIVTKNIQASSYSKKLENEKLPLVTYSRELSAYNGNYFIFGDIVYSIGNLITSHPGGFQLIDHIKEREVDRYMYASEELESVDKMISHCHSVDSIKMAGEPIARLFSICPYGGMGEMNEVVVYKTTLPCESNYIFSAFLSPKDSSKGFIFKGYQYLSQIGKYYTLTINNNKTRLYTMVNFLHPTNIELMQRITGRTYTERIIKTTTTHNNDILSERNLASGDRIMSCVPVLMKKYENGEFTKLFLEDQFKGECQLSKPLGKGMNLEEMPQGQIIMFAAGTGLYPYADLIDLLYKQMLVRSHSVHSSQIISKNPLLEKTPLLDKFKFKIFISVPTVDDIHLITLQQLSELSSMNLIQVELKRNTKDDNFGKLYPGIRQVDRKFQDCIREVLKEVAQISQIYVCGPTPLSRCLVKLLASCNIPYFRYKVL